MHSLWNVHWYIADGSFVRVLPADEVDDRSALWLIYTGSNVLTADVRTFIGFLLQKDRQVPGLGTGLTATANIRRSYNRLTRGLNVRAGSVLPLKKVRCSTIGIDSKPDDERLFRPEWPIWETGRS